MLNRKSNTRNSYRMNKKMITKVNVASLSMQKKVVELTDEISLYLFNYYVSKVASPIHNLLDDVYIGRSIGWNKRKTQKHRLRLANAGLIYFKQRRIQEVLHNHWVIGIDEVIEFKENASDITGEIL